MKQFEVIKCELESTPASPCNLHSSKHRRWDCMDCNKRGDIQNIQTNKDIRINIRLFSPIRCAQHFNDNRLESRQNRNCQISNNTSSGMQVKEEVDNLCLINKVEFEEIKSIHNDIVKKTSSLVEKVKQSRYGGFFSPRKLRNRINLGNFSKITAMSPQNIKIKDLNSCNILGCQDSKSNLLSQIESNIIENSARVNKVSNKITFISDSVLNNINNRNRTRKFKLRFENFKNLKRNEVNFIDDDFLSTQQRIKSNFSL